MKDMKCWIVTTPEWEEIEPITDDGRGPSEWGCDYIIVRAPNKRAAITGGVKTMLDPKARYENGERYRWCIGARGDGVNPFAGVKAMPYCPAENSEDESELCGAWNEYGTARCESCGWTLDEIRRFMPDVDAPQDVRDPATGWTLRELQERRLVNL